VQKNSKYHNDFIVDRLTNSIQNRISGDSFVTEVSLLSQTDLKQIQKKNGWLFNWKEELSHAKHFGNLLMVIDTPAALDLVNKYYKY
jgi:hypothetical protein